MGAERLVSMLEEQGKIQSQPQTDVYFVVAGKNTSRVAQQLAETLRNDLPGLRMTLHCGGGSFKSQMKKADKSGARIALIVGESEVENQTVNLKFMHEDKAQQTVDQTKLVDQLKQIL
jgi:histidyl-tRNA synthetase